MAEVAEARRHQQVRQAGSALYHVATAIALAWEGARLAPNHRRLALALLVLRHRVLPRDPLAAEADAGEALLPALLAEGPLSLDDALRLLPH